MYDDTQIHIHFINNIINQYNISLYVNVLGIMNYNVITNKQHFWLSCPSLIWEVDDFTMPKKELFNKLYQLDLFDVILCQSHQLYSQLKNHFRHKSIFYSTYIPENIPLLKNTDEKTIVANVDSLNEWNMNTLIDSWEQSNWSTSGSLYLISNNRYSIERVSYSLPKDFKLGDTFVIKNINVFIDTSKKSHELGKTYYYNHKKDRLSEFLSKQKRTNIYLEDNKPLERIRSSHKFIDITRGYKYNQFAINNHIYSLLLNINGNKDILGKGELLDVTECNVGTQHILTFSKEDVIQFINREVEDEVSKDIILYPQLFSTILSRSNYQYMIEQNNELQKTFSQKTIDKNIKNLSITIMKYGSKMVSIFGNIDTFILFYLLSECSNVQEWQWIQSKKCTEEEEKTLKQLKHIFSYKKIHTLVCEDERQISKYIPTNHYHLLVTNSMYNHIFSKYNDKHFIKNLYILNKDYNVYTVVHQENKSFHKYSSINVQKQYLLLEDDGCKYIVNKSSSSNNYDVDLFYGVTKEDLVSKSNWQQCLINEGYLHLNHSLHDPNEFVRFFRHRILWEELYDNKIPHALIQELPNEKYKSFPMSEYPFDVPELDIIFFKNMFNMECYFVTYKGLEKLLMYSKPMVFPLPVQIKNMCLTSNLFYYCIGKIPNNTNYLSLNKEIIEPKKNNIYSLNISDLISYYGYQVYLFSWNTITLPFWIVPYSKMLFTTLKQKCIRYCVDLILKKNN